MTDSSVEPRPRRTVRWTVAVFGAANRRGRWRPASETSAVAVFGHSRLDLRDAHVEGGEVTIQATAVFGNVDVIVPEGTDVELSGFAVFGYKQSRVPDSGESAPLRVWVKAFALFGHVQVRTLAEGEPEDSIETVASVVQHERPDLGAHAAPDGTVTLLFSDIEGFSEMTVRLGDQRAHEVLHAHNAIVREQVDANGGFEAKAEGDGFMFAFPSARRAVLCAVGIQRGLNAYTLQHADEPVRVRIGLHTGEAIKEANDFFGKNVILAARIAQHARGGEILVSSLVKELTDSSGDLHYVDGREVELKGLPGPHRVWSVRWQEDVAAPQMA